MSLGTPSIGEAGRRYDCTVWSGEKPPRDEFFWLSQINKCTLLINSREGLLDERLAAAFARGLRTVIHGASVPGSFRPKMYVRYEPLMVEACGIDVTAMHAGRSSQDMHSTFQRAILREEALRFAGALNRARRGLWELADRNRTTLVPNYTNGVAAQPNRLAHTWLGHLAGFTRDFEMFELFWKHLNLCPMGTTVLNGTSWPLNRRAMSEMLGFDAPVENAYDASQISGTDCPVEMALMLAGPLLHITQFIQDIMVQYAQPRPWILVSATYASSAMPQKRNPGALLDIRRDANAVLGSLQGILLRAHNVTPGMYDVKDVELNAEILRDAASVTEAFADVLGLLRINPARSLEELSLDWTSSQELADVLMARFGVPFRLGHRVASRMVSLAREGGFTPLTIPYASVRSIYAQTVAGEETAGASVPAEFPLDEEAFRAVLDPEEIVERRRTEGGPQKDELERQMRSAEKQIEADEGGVARRTERLASAEARLEEAFEALCRRFTSKS